MNIPRGLKVLSDPFIMTKRSIVSVRIEFILGWLKGVPFDPQELWDVRGQCLIWVLNIRNLWDASAQKLTFKDSVTWTMRRLWLYACIYIYIYIHYLCVYIYIYICIYYIYIYIYMHVCMYVCMYIYIYMYMYIYIYIYIYTHILYRLWPRFWLPCHSPFI